jgi:tRNA-dihydrouridine synthase A
MMRGISRHALLYTEMVTVGAVLHGDRERLLGFDEDERPLSLQLGGDDPQTLAQCARIAEGLGFDEINLNVGCPSDRVQSGRFGACLMGDPERVAEAVGAMRAASSKPITVKHRIGIDERDSYEDLERFVETVASSGCDRFSVHARKAWLTGLSPKENRDIPPLRYEDVYRLKASHPGLVIEINGGVRTLEEARQHLGRVDAVMVGRAAFDDPFAWAAADGELFASDSAAPTRREVIERMIEYAERAAEAGVFLSHVARPMLGLISAKPGARTWRRHLTVHSVRQGAGPEVIRDAMSLVPDHVLDEPGARRCAAEGTQEGGLTS